MEESPELRLMCELLQGWGYRAFQTTTVVRGEEYLAIQVQPKPESLYFMIWATERNHLHLRLLLQTGVLDGEDNFDAAFDNLTVGALKAAIDAARAIRKAWLMILKVVRPDKELHLSSRLFGDTKRSGSNVAEELAKRIHEQIFGE